MNKEQVSVDTEVKIVNYKAIEESEYERLKRLDVNVKKLINELKLIDGESTPSSLGKLLKSLYDENTQES